jgi:excisionase family DNA binding protein
MSGLWQEALPFSSDAETRGASISPASASRPSSLPELLSVRAAARFLGIGVSTLYALLADGRFPITPVMVGKTMKLPRRRLEQWLADGGDVRS